jgi:hypothetical protein
MADFAATLGGTPITILDGASIDDLLRDVRLSAGLSRPFATARNYAPALSASIPIYMSAATKDLLTAAETTIRRLLWAGTTLVITPTDATVGRTLTVYPGARLRTPWSSSSRDLQNWGEYVIEGSVGPYAEEAEVTLLNASAQTAPLLLSLGTIGGDVASAIDLTITGSDADLHSCYVGILKAGSSLALTDLRKEAED